MAFSYSAQPQVAASSTTNIVAGYYGSTPDKTTLANLVNSGAAAHLTHLIYAFAASDSTNPCTGAPSISSSDLINLEKLQNAGVKILVSVGGENSGAEFRAAVKIPEFASTCVDYLMTDSPNQGFEFDGIDIDWETPGNKTDEKNFNKLLGAFRTALDQHQQRNYLDAHLLLTAAFSPEHTAYGWLYIDFSGQHYPPGAASSVDFFNVEFYGYAYQGDGITESDAPLYEINADLYGNADVYGADKGIITDGKVPASQIVLGIPFYGVHYTGVSNGQTLGQPGGLEYTSQGVVNYPYYQLRSKSGAHYNDGNGSTGCKRNPVPVTCDGIGASSWIWNSSTGDLWAFDNPETITIKGEYAQAQQLGGLMAWNLMDDVPSGTLLNAMATALAPTANINIPGAIPLDR